jgi:mRNA interferase MazF
MKKGDIVLIPFPYTDLLGNKKRPAMILIESESFITVCFISSQINYFNEFDFHLYPNDSNRLKKESLVKLNKLATIDKDLVIGRIGSLSEKEITILDLNLRGILKL